MVVAELVAVNICAHIFDLLIERKERLPRGFGQPRGVPWRSHDGDAGDLPADVRVVSVHSHMTGHASR